MKINTENLVPLAEANQNFSKVARMVDEKGSAVILKNNKPKYILIEFSRYEEEQTAGDEEMDAITARLLMKNRKAYEELSK